MTDEQLVQLRNLTLEHLGALLILFRSARWREHIARADVKQREAATNLELLVEARFLKLQTLPLSRMAQRLQSHFVPLTEAGEKVADALDNIRHVDRVIAAADHLTSVANRVIAPL